MVGASGIRMAVAAGLTLALAGCGLATSSGRAGGPASSGNPSPTPTLPTLTGGADPSPSSPGVQGVTTQPSPPSNPAPSDGSLLIALGSGNSGQTIRVVRGTRITITLHPNSGYQWTGLTSTSSSVVVIRSSAASSSGSEAEASAIGVGMARLQASDNPSCGVCRPPSQLWEVTIQVA
jgi:hypothetical protein